MSNMNRGNFRGRGRGRGYNNRFPRNVPYYGPPPIFQQFYDAPLGQFPSNIPPPPFPPPPRSPQQQQPYHYGYPNVNEVPQPYAPPPAANFPAMPMNQVSMPMSHGYLTINPQPPMSHDVQSFHHVATPPMTMMPPNQEIVYYPVPQPSNENYYPTDLVMNHQESIQAPQMYNTYHHVHRDPTIVEIPDQAQQNQLAIGSTESDVSVEDPQESRSPSPEIQPVADDIDIGNVAVEELLEAEQNANNQQFAPIIVQFFREPIVCHASIPACNCGGVNNGLEVNAVIDQAQMQPSYTVQVLPGGEVVVVDEKGNNSSGQSRNTSSSCSQLITITHQLEMNNTRTCEVVEIESGGGFEAPEVRTTVQVEELEEEDLDSFHDAFENFHIIEVDGKTLNEAFMLTPSLTSGFEPSIEGTKVTPLPEPEPLTEKVSAAEDESLAKKEPSTEKEPSMKKEHSMENEKPLEEVQSLTKKEQLPKKEPWAKKKPSPKRESVVKVEPTTKEEPLTKEEPSTSDGKTETTENVASNSKPRRKRSNNKKRNNNRK